MAYFNIALALMMAGMAPTILAQFGGSDPALAGPYFVRSSEGIMCIYYRIRNFAIRGYNTLQATARSPAECARMCNDRTWCNSFEYSVDGRCFVNANDIYVPETITAWNTAFEWDYWQLRDCLPSGAGEAGSNPGSAFQHPQGQGEPDQSGPSVPDGLSSDTLPSPMPANGPQQNDKNANKNAQVNLKGGEGRGTQRIKGAPVKDVSGFPAVSGTTPPAADANGARIQMS